MRRLALLGVLAGASLLSACGFTPMYGETGVSGGLSRIAVTTPDDRLGYRLREQLEDAFGRDGAQAPLSPDDRGRAEPSPSGPPHRRHRQPL